MTPLAAALIRLAQPGPGQDRPPLIAISGAQGSGKTTLARSVAAGIGAAHFSLDDVYATRADRQALARTVHPLMATRGPPGTHDLELLSQILDSLLSAEPQSRTPIPAFDKLADDRQPHEHWPVFVGRPSAILVDGWCLGALPQPDEALAADLNGLERDQDPDGIWRRAVNQALAGPYAALFDRFDGFLHLLAPDFSVVQAWREEQEAGLLGAPPSPARRRELTVF
ncbi:MAG: kinase, partial [Caulobacter sp.]|nr:kinase [Caulobacter sp.]